MNCKNCGAPLEEGTKFCINCGSQVETIERVEAETVSEPEPVKTADDFDYYKEPKTEQTQSNQTYSEPQYQKPQYENYGGTYNNGNKQTGNTLAIVSLVLGILSIVCCCFSALQIILAIGALVTGIISVKSTENGKGMAIAGIVMGGLMILSGIIGIVFGMAYMNMLMPSGTDFNNYEDFEDIIENFSL